MALRKEDRTEALVENLLGEFPHSWIKGRDDRVVTGVTHDSRRASHGTVFVAMRGMNSDGLSHVAEAIARGAATVVVGTGRAEAFELAGATRIIEVEDERTALAVMSRNLHGCVDQLLPVVGITGTNGKTTTCRILTEILEASGTKTGQLGTVIYGVGDAEIVAGLTTPEAPDIHEYLQRMSEAGCGACVMEVSSVALDRRRVYGIDFRVGVFTNLTRDHLDYHGDMETYFQAKRTLFEALGSASTAVVNLDDEYGVRIAALWKEKSSAPVSALLTYGEDPAADIRLESMETSVSGSRITVQSESHEIELSTSLVGRPNASNVMAAVAAARAMEKSWDDIATGVASVQFVPGRLEPVCLAEKDQSFRVFVDYAHTDDALRGLLETVRQVTERRVIVVFGCGGDRDRTKRPLMGAHADRLADLVWVTSDNPRSEDPAEIIKEVVAGMDIDAVRSADRVHVEPDRLMAIEQAITTARAGDTVVIAGKGHETFQISGDSVSHFDDRSVAREALERIL